MRRILTALAGSTALLLLTACGGGGEASDSGDSGPDDITLGLIPIVDVAPAYLGIEEGFFEERGLNVKVQTAEGGAAIVPGVVSGDFQFGFSNVTSLLLAQSEGLPLKIVAAGDSSTGKQGADFSGVVVPKGSEIEDAAGLAGKTVAVNTLKNIGDTTVRQSVQKAGGDPSTVKFVELEFPDMPAALAKGQVDAAWVVEPFLTITKDQGGTDIASNLVDTQPNLMIAAYFTSEETLASDPELVDRFTAALNESLTYAEQNPDAVREIIQSYTDIPADVANRMVLPKWSSEINTQTVELLAQLAREDGLVQEPVDTQALLP
ncbi:MAG TPA: ABC transporter substrate-binding protein [Nocardioidaceae bacterium]|nr:ABC transporter substrate-binding protein [Nocardioidaceae bacterium]